MSAARGYVAGNGDGVGYIYQIYWLRVLAAADDDALARLQTLMAPD